MPAPRRFSLRLIFAVVAATPLPLSFFFSPPLPPYATPFAYADIAMLLLLSLMLRLLLRVATAPPLPLPIRCYADVFHAALFHAYADAMLTRYAMPLPLLLLRHGSAKNTLHTSARCQPPLWRFFATPAFTLLYAIDAALFSRDAIALLRYAECCYGAISADAFSRHYCSPLRHYLMSCLRHACRQQDML